MGLRGVSWLLCFFFVCLVDAAVEPNSTVESCIDWAPSLPERLSTWVLGLLSVQGILLTALGRSQPLEELQMPFWKHTRVTLGISVAASLSLFASIGTILLEAFQSSSPGTFSCDFFQVFWTVTPVVVGTAGTGCMFLVWLAHHRTSTNWPLLERNDPRIQGARFGILPGDSYGNGKAATKMKKIGWLLDGVWVVGVLLALLITIRGNLLAGLLSTAGIIAVWSNTLLPEWNKSVLAGGQDTLSANTGDLDCVEVNIIGEYSTQTAVVIQPHIPGMFDFRYRTNNEDRIMYYGRVYAFSNAHAFSTDFKENDFTLEPYMPVVGNPTQLADLIVDKTGQAEKRVCGIFANKTDVANPAHRGAFTVLVTSLLDKEAWAGVEGQRRRFQAAAVAQAWQYQLRRDAGGMFNFDDSEATSKCDGQRCRNPLHRWSRLHVLKNTAEEEAKYLLGHDAKLQPVRNGFRNFVDDLWLKIKDRAGAQHTNSSMLLSLYLMAFVVVVVAVGPLYLTPLVAEERLPQMEAERPLLDVPRDRQRHSNSASDTLGTQNSGTARRPAWKTRYTHGRPSKKVTERVRQRKFQPRPFIP